MDKKLIIGLGNPGKNYEKNRHNIGFMCIDKLCQVYGISLDQQKEKTLWGSGVINNKKVFLAKPLTYMNVSGHSVKYLMNYYKIPLENVIIIFDDFSLKFGKLRFRAQGRAGGHNGIKSIISQLGIEFKRLKIGVGEPVEHMAVSDYVLSNFSKNELKDIGDLLDYLPSLTDLFLADNVEDLLQKAGEFSLA
jgi:peptidyl-tRNA hydrolase, PTH1 family